MSALKLPSQKPLLEDCFGHNQRNNEEVLLPRQLSLLISVKYPRPPLFFSHYIKTNANKITFFCYGINDYFLIILLTT